MMRASLLFLVVLGLVGCGGAPPPKASLKPAGSGWFCKFEDCARDHSGDCDAAKAESLKSMEKASCVRKATAFCFARGTSVDCFRSKKQCEAKQDIAATLKERNTQRRPV